MGEVFNEKYYEYEIILENGTYILQTEELKQIENTLNMQDIGFKCLEFRSGPQASLFRGLILFINKNLTSLIIGDIMMPAAYDCIKHILKKIRKSIKESSYFIVTSKEVVKPDLILTFKTSKGRIEAPIPEGLSDTQFDKYMDLLSTALQSLTEDKIEKEQLIAEFDPKSRQVIIKTIFEYGIEKSKK